MAINLIDIFHFESRFHISLIRSDFKIDKCDSANSEMSRKIDDEKRTFIYLHINNIYNLDYLSNVLNLQIEIKEFRYDVNLDVKSVNDDSISFKNRPLFKSKSLIKESDLDYIDSRYPNLVFEETDYNSFNNHENLVYKTKFARSTRRIFKKYYYVEEKKMLIKKYKLNLQTRCLISMQSYPFIKFTV